MKKYLLAFITLSLLLCEASFTGGMAFAANKVGDSFTINYTTAPTYSLKFTITKVYTSSTNLGEVTVEMTTAPTSNRSISIPETRDFTFSGTACSYKVTAIKADGFKDCTYLTGVTIPTHVTSIGSNAFSGCSNLTSVTWNAVNCTDFASYSASPFYYSRTNITTFSISTSIQHIPAYLCYGMTGITGSKSFSSSLQSIGDSAFRGCTGLTSLSFTSATNLESIGSYAFYNCNAVTSSIKLPASLTSLGAYAFQSCKSITGLTFADGCQITEIPTYAFHSCHKLAGTITIPTSVTSIGNYAFYNCSTAVAINIMQATNLTTIGNSAFAGMSACAGLLYIPSKVTSIGTLAFSNMTALDGIVAMPTTPPTVANANSFNSVNKSIPVYVKDETTKNKYIADACTGWKDFTNYKYETDQQQCGDNLYWKFKFSTNRVIFTGSGDMWNYDNSSNKAPWRVYNDVLKYVDYCNDMTSIGDYAFYQCGNYIPASFTIKASIERIGQYAFYQCPGITSLTFGANSNLTSIGQRAFYGCSGIKNVTLPEGLEVIPTYCFTNCTALTNVKFPSTLTTIGNSTFQGCSSLKSADLTSSTATLEAWAFYNCSALEFIKCDRTTPPTAASTSFNGVNKTTTYICVPEESNDAYCAAVGWSAFCEKTGQEIGGITGDVNWKLNFATHVLTIFGSGAMANTYSSSGISVAPWLAYAEDIYEVVVDENVTNIGQYAFYQATNLTKVTLPSTISYIGDYAFSGDNQIETIICAASLVPEVRSHSVYSSGLTYVSSAFSNVPSNAVVVVPLSALATYKTTGVVSNSSSKTGWNYFTNYHATGTCGTEGDNLTWDYADATNALTISGYGEMVDYANSNTNRSPWYTIREDLLHVQISEGAENISRYAFYNCENVQTVQIPASVTEMEFEAFWNCYDLESVTFADESHLTTIGNYVFENCSTLTSITIPASVTSIGSSAFSGCSGITEVHSNAMSVPSLQSNSFPAAVLSSAKLYLPHNVAAKAAYRAASGWSSFTEANTFPKIVQFSLNGKSGDEPDPQFFDNLTSKASVPSEPSVSYYSFGGWYENAEGTGSAFAFSTTNITADKTLYAKWTEDLHSVTVAYMCGEATIQASGSVSGVGVATAQDATALSIAGYTFSTWSAMPSGVTTSDELTSATISINATADDKTITANYTINQYTVSFDSNGGSEVSSITQDYNTAVTAPADPTREGYTFNGWSPEVPSTMPAENTECVAQWTINQYTISFDSNGGSEVSSITQDYNSAVTAPADPTREGYTFNGWSPAVPSTMPAENTECVAQWTINQYTISFDSNGGSAVASITQDYSSAVTAPADPTKTGYTFAGWSPAVPSTMPAENTECVAQWTENVFSFADTDTDNSKIVAANGKLALSVTIGRTIWRDGYYNSMCLPFSLTSEQLAASPLAGYKALKRLSDATITGEDENRELNIQLEPITEITAGEPFFISYEVGLNITNPEFTDVTVTAPAPNAISKGDVTCRGLYTSTDLGTATTNLFLGANNVLYWPAEGQSTIKGLRAYFVINPGAPAKSGMRVRLSDRPAEVPTALEETNHDPQIPIHKYIRDGVLFIERDGKTYNAQGVLVH